MRNRLLIFFSLPCFLFSQNPGDALFSSSLVHDINIEFPQADYWDSLLYYKALGDNTNSDWYMKGRVTIDGLPIDCVGVRLKGNASYGHPGKKKSIKIQFNEYVQTQEFDNLRSFHLNNSAFDPTMLREKIFLDMLNRHGLPAPRCTFARVSYNGVYVGLYKIVESIDKRFLNTHFTDNEGNLYKGDPNGTLEWQGTAQSEYENDYELKTNETANDWSGLIDLIDRINNSGGAFQQRVEERFNVSQYIKVWAANNVFVNLDSYFHLAHNYYIYDDTITDKFQWITWDVGIVFGVFPTWFSSIPAETSITHMYHPMKTRPLNLHLLETPGHAAQYYRELCFWLYNELTTEVLFPRIDSLANRIRADVLAEPEENRMFTTMEFEGNLGYEGVSAFLLSADVPGLKDFIEKRRKSIVRQMCIRRYSCYLNQSYDESAASDVIIYPNPANEKINIRFTVPSESNLTACVIADAMGRVVYSGDILLSSGQMECTLVIPGLQDGIYFMKLSGACEDVSRRILFLND